MTVKFKLEGFKEFDQVLKKLPNQPLRRAVKAALMASGKPQQKRLKEILKAHKHTGNLSKAVARVSPKKARGFQGKGAVVVFVGYRKNAHHAHLVEFGSGPRFLKSGKFTGQMPAFAPLRRSFDTTRSEQNRVLKTELGPRLEKEARKLARK